MRLDTQRVAQQRAAEARQAIEQGGQRLREVKRQIGEALKQPAAARAATDETLDGLMAIYERTSHVVLALKELAAKEKQAGAVINTYG